MNIYYMPKPKKDYKEIARIKNVEHSIARIIQTISFIVLTIIALLCCN